MNRLIKPFTLTIALSSLSGCFYLVPQGQGGVAERYVMNEQLVEREKLLARLHSCYGAMAQHREKGVPQLFPTLYQQIDDLLVMSNRYQTAEYFHLAKRPLAQAEILLDVLDYRLSNPMAPVGQYCHRDDNYDNQELCI